MLDSITTLNKLISSDCNLSLTAERISAAEGRRVTEYEILEVVANEPTIQKTLGLRLRTTALIKLYDMIEQVSFRVLSSIDEMKPGEVARLHASLVGVFASMTANDNKQLFDFDDEARKVAQEFDIPVEEARTELRQLLSKVGTK